MEFFIPGLLVFLLSLAVTFVLAPKATPFIAAIMSIVFLVYGVYHHHSLFAAEYRLSTWQDGLKAYSPAILIFAVVLYVIYGILAFFTSGQVPVPSLPNISLPSSNSITNQVSNSMESLGNSIANTANNMGNSLSNAVNTMGNTIRGNNKNRKNNNGISRSFLETV